MMAPPSSARLLRAFLSGEPDADEHLADHAWRIAFRAANIVLHHRDDAQDVAQDVAMETLRQADRIQDPEALDAWIALVSTRAARRSAKRRHHDRERPLTQLADEDTPATHPEGLDSHADHIALMRALREAVASLPRRQREILVLHYVLDMTHEQIAATLGIRPGTAGAAITRARAALRQRHELQAFSPAGGEV